MSIDNAIRSAIEYEKKIVGVYEEAVQKSSNSVAKLVFQQLADEERGHVDFLRAKLEEWQASATLSESSMATIVPSKKTIDEEVKKLNKTMNNEGYSDDELAMLERARTVEEETSRFYEEMARALPEAGRKLFERFQEIEDGHLYMVQAEIDCLSDNGFWMGIPEFDMEAMG